MSTKRTRCVWKLRRWGGFYGKCDGVRMSLDTLPSTKPWAVAGDSPWVCDLRSTRTGKRSSRRVSAKTPALAKRKCAALARMMAVKGRK